MLDLPIPFLDDGSCNNPTNPIDLAMILPIPFLDVGSYEDPTNPVFEDRSQCDLPVLFLQHSNGELERYQE